MSNTPGIKRHEKTSAKPYSEDKALSAEDKKKLSESFHAFTEISGRHSYFPSKK